MDKYFILFNFNFLNMELNLLIIFLYLFKNFKIPSFKNKIIYENFKNNFYEHSEYIFDIHMNEKKCDDLNYNKFVCNIFIIEKDFLDNYESNYSYISEIKEKNKDKYSNLIFLYNFLNYFKNIFFYIKFNFPTFLKKLEELLKIYIFMSTI